MASDQPQKKPAPRKTAKPAAVNPASLKTRIRALLAGEFGANALLLGGAAICFGLFVRNSLQVRAVGSGGAIAVLRSGEIDRKRFGTPDFGKVRVGEPLFNRDAIWVPASQTALIVYDDQSTIQVAEKTFLILRRGLGRSDEAGGVTLLQGKLEVSPSSGIFTNRRISVETSTGKVYRVVGGSGAARVDSSGSIQGGGFAPSTALPNDALEAPPSQQPNASPVPNPGASASPIALPDQNSREPLPLASRSPAPLASVTSQNDKVVPIPGTVYFLISSHQAPVSFGWPKAATGNLSVEDESSATIAQLPLTGASFTKSVFKEGHTYRWRVSGPSGEALFGPFEFSVMHFEQKALDEILRNDPRRTVEVVE